MKKIFKKTVKLLTNIAYILIMLIGAKHAMNLPFNWGTIGYLTMFIIGLIAWTVYNSNYKLFYNAGYDFGWEDHKINAEIFKEINKGEKDEFDIEMPKEHDEQYIVLAGTHKNFCSDNDEYIYNITAIESLDETTKITFTKNTKQ